MAANTKIEWTAWVGPDGRSYPGFSFNPWVGCTKVAPACDHCYAESWAKRSGMVVWGGKRRRTTESYWKNPRKWDAAARAAGARPRVFCASLADVFDNKVPESWRADLFRLIRETPHLDWLLLTKRIGIAAALIERALIDGHLLTSREPAWPWPNVWLGATVANQDEADRDIPKLLGIPAAIRFLSCEPMLGPIDLSQHFFGFCAEHDYPGGFCLDRSHQSVQHLNWVIAGGESGPRARPMHPAWLRALRDQCVTARVPFFFKQWGEWQIASVENGHDGSCMPDTGERYTWIGLNGETYNPSAPPDQDCWAMAKVGKKKSGRQLDGREWNEFPTTSLEQRTVLC